MPRRDDYRDDDDDFDRPRRGRDDDRYDDRPRSQGRGRDEDDRPRRRRDDDEEPRKGMSTGMLIGIIVGSLLFVVGLVVVGLFVSGVATSRSSFARIQSTNNIKQIGIGMHSANDSMMKMPPAAGRFGQDDATFFFHILPFVEQDNVFRAKNKSAVIKTYLAPGDTTTDTRPLTSYAVNHSLLGNQGMQLHRITKGSSNMAVLVERYAVTAGTPHAWADTGNLMVWYSGKNTKMETETPDKCTQDAAHGLGGTAFPILICDGSVRTVTKAQEAGFRRANDPDDQGAMPFD